MDPIKALELDHKLNPRHLRDLTKAVAVSPGARRAMLEAREQAGVPTPAGDAGDAPINDVDLVVGLSRDYLAWDHRTHRVIATQSQMPVNRAIRPHDESDVFDSVEQCMEFVMRYFRTEMQNTGRMHGSFGEDWPEQRNIAAEVRQMAEGKLRKMGYTAYLNGGSVPPRAGDVLSLEAPDGEFHVALVTKVHHKDGKWFVRVFEANVPFNTNDPEIAHHFSELPMEVKNGRFKILSAKTSEKGYGMDMDVVGWIHPLGEKALPGAAAKAPESKEAMFATQPGGGRLLGVA